MAKPWSRWDGDTPLSNASDTSLTISLNFCCWTIAEWRRCLAEYEWRHEDCPGKQNKTNKNQTSARLNLQLWMKQNIWFPNGFINPLCFCFVFLISSHWISLTSLETSRPLQTSSLRTYGHNMVDLFECCGLICSLIERGGGVKSSLSYFCIDPFCMSKHSNHDRWFHLFSFKIEGPVCEIFKGI